MISTRASLNVKQERIKQISSTKNKELTEKILGKTLDEWKKGDKQKMLEEMNEKLFAHRIALQGNALGDQFGTTVIAREAQIADVDITEETKALAQELEESL